MPPARTYSTAGAFRTALEARLKKTSLTDQTDLNRLRRQVSFDRLLARLFQEKEPPWALKKRLRAGTSLQGCSVNGRHRPHVAEIDRNFIGNC
jgi:hypothetical protein